MGEVRVVMQLPLLVSVWWPKDVPLDNEILKNIAVSASSQSFEVSIPLKETATTWLRVYTESSDGDVEFLEGAE